jgi:hypothetical protein
LRPPPVRKRRKYGALVGILIGAEVMVVDPGARCEARWATVLAFSGLKPFGLF